MVRVTIVGGGYGGITAAKALDECAEVTLIEQKDTFVNHAAALRATVDPDWAQKIFLPYDHLLKNGRVVHATAMSVDGTTNVTTTDNSYRETRVTQTLQAVSPSAPSSPDFYKLSGMGALAGLVIGYLVVFMRRLMDNRVRHNSDVEELLGSSVLAVVPKPTELNAKGRQNVDGLGQAAEALREHGNHVHNVEACDTNLFHVISFECIHSYDI